MYNRYIRNDAGVYERIPVEEPRASAPPGGSEGPPPPPPPPPGASPPPGGQPGGHPPPRGGKGILSSILDKLNLKDIDTGDLLLLILIFLLFREGEDEELLIALGLLLIL